MPKKFIFLVSFSFLFLLFIGFLSGSGQSRTSFVYAQSSTEIERTINWRYVVGPQVPRGYYLLRIFSAAGDQVYQSHAIGDTFLSFTVEEDEWNRLALGQRYSASICRYTNDNDPDYTICSFAGSWIQGQSSNPQNPTDAPVTSAPIPTDTPAPVQFGITVINYARGTEYGVDQIGVALYKKNGNDWEWVGDKLSEKASQGANVDQYGVGIVLPDANAEYKLEPRAKNAAGQDIGEVPGGVSQRVYNDGRPTNGGFACTGLVQPPQSPTSCVFRGSDMTSSTIQSFEIRPIAAPTATPAFVTGGRAAIRVTVHSNPYLHPIATFGFKVEKKVDGTWIPETRGVDPNYLDPSHPGEVMTVFRGVESGNETQTIYQDMDRRYEYRFSSIARTRDGNLFTAQDVRFGASMCRGQFQSDNYCIIPGTVDQGDATNPATAFLYVDWTPPTPTFNPDRITCRANGWPKTVRPGVPFTASFTLNNPKANADSVLFSLRGFTLPPGFTGTLLTQNVPEQWINIPARQSVEHTVLLTVNSYVPRSVYGIAFDTSSVGDGDCLDTQGNNSLTLAVDPNAPLSAPTAQPTARPNATSTPRVSSPTPQPSVSPLGLISQVTATCQPNGLNFSFAPVQGADFYSMTLDRLGTPRTQTVSNDSAQNLCTGTSCAQPIDAPHGEVYGNLAITASGNGQSQKSQLNGRYYCPVEENACSFAQTVKLQDKFGNPLNLNTSINRSYDTSTLYLPSLTRRTGVALPSIAIQNSQGTVTENLVADRQRGEELNRLILPANYKALSSTCNSNDTSVCLRRNLEEPSATFYPICSTSVEYTWSLACTQFSSAFTVEPAAGESITAADMQNVRISMEKVTTSGVQSIGQWPMTVDANGRSTLSWNPSELPTEVNGVRVLLADQLKAKVMVPENFEVVSVQGGATQTDDYSATVPLQCGNTSTISWTIRKVAPKTWNVRPQAVCRTSIGGYRVVPFRGIASVMSKVGYLPWQESEDAVTSTSEFSITSTRGNEMLNMGVIWSPNSSGMPINTLEPVSPQVGMTSTTHKISFLTPNGVQDVTVPHVQWSRGTIAGGPLTIQFLAPDAWCAGNSGKVGDGLGDIPDQISEPFSNQIQSKDEYPSVSSLLSLGSGTFMSSASLLPNTPVQIYLPGLQDDDALEEVTLFMRSDQAPKTIISNQQDYTKGWVKIKSIDCLTSDCLGSVAFTIPDGLSAGTYHIAALAIDNKRPQQGQHIGVIASELIAGTPFESSTKPCTESTAQSTYCTTEGLSTILTIGSSTK